MTVTLVLLALFAVLLTGLDIGFALAGLGIAMLVLGDYSLLMVPQTLMASMDNFLLLSVPLFILMSNVLLKGGVGEDLFAAVQSWIGHWPGGLAVASIVSCALFGAISGSSVATAATIGTVAIPAMLARGYEPRLVYGTLAAGGTLGIIIPPSIPMIVYGYVTAESIVDLFLAGIGPGILLSALFAAFVSLRTRFAPGYRPVARAGWGERRAATRRALPSLALALAIVGGIYAGVFTPTEAAAVGFVAALIITLGPQRRLRLAQLPAIAFESMQTSVMVMFIIAGAKLFGQAITLYQIPQEVTALVVGHLTGAGAFVFAICALLLVMGFVLETLSMMLLMLPISHPSLAGFGIDAIWFGVLFTMMIECALITPPVGLNLFVIQAVAGQSTAGATRVGLSEVAQGSAPFVVLILIVIGLLWMLPEIALFIPFQL